MKKRYFLPMLAVVASLSFSSCSDFLTEDPRGQLTPDGFFDSQEALTSALNALYYNVQQSQCNSNPAIVQCQGDDVTSTTGSNKAAYLSADAFEVPTDTKGVEFLWKWQYNIIQAANLLIDHANDVPETVSRENVNIALGNAYYWRAYAYFQLVREFGPLPVNLHNVPDNNATVPSSVEEIYDLIVSDLLEAEKCGLPTKYTGANQAIGDMNIYISEQAVKSTLAAVYMNMAGYPMKKTEYYALAADKAKEVVDGVNSGKYPNGLVADWADVYSYGNNFSKEAIVGITYHMQTGGWSNYDSQMTSCHQVGSLQGWGDFLAERKYWATFPDGPRKDYVYAKKMRTNNGVCVDWWATTDGKPYDETNAVVTEYRPMFVAFTLNTGDGGPAAAPYDYTKPFWGGMCAGKTHQIIRYSEVICWFAEAAARSGKYQAEATAELQKVMARAYTTMPAITDLATQAFLEHGYEVAGMTFSLVTRRADEFRLETLKEAYDYRVGPQDYVLVPAGTLTESRDAAGNAFTYTTTEDLRLKENMPVTAAWNGENSIYSIYPPKEVEKNPNLKR
ncbi:MAG: RagB/SusD family nutrient uptake outer membrane protein [Pseudoflavonifractor sp.]|nr:RagB/SusD family nutrient uptake outer membrane protein [Alloprevotella sp.]MCM1117475.1 RagB/SusD family nutrient uptake outer membrane protein [Pseudoflavonifractor sp.]